MSDINLTSMFSYENKQAGDAAKRPLGRYPGSKNRLAAWLISYFPGHHDTFILPYGGLAATLFKKVRSGLEVYNDLNDDVVHLFKMIREQEDALIHAIEYTPWSPTSLLEAQEPTDDPVERARRFFCLLWMSWLPFDPKPSFRRQMLYSRGHDGKNSMVGAARLFAQTDYLRVIAERLRGVVIENMDAVELIKMYDYDRALFYCDPPYMHKTRGRKKYYLFELGTEQHRNLASTLNGISGMAIISGYACDLYTTLYEDVGWQRVDRLARTQGRSRVDSIWLNPRVIDELEKERILLTGEDLPLLQLIQRGDGSGDNSGTTNNVIVMLDQSEVL